MFIWLVSGAPGKFVFRKLISYYSNDQNYSFLCNCLASQTGPPSKPKTVLEALEQRMQKYLITSEQAAKEGSSGKSRRMGRIAKQYKDAIRNHKAGRPVNFDELPVPPGFPPIPGIARGCS